MGAATRGHTVLRSYSVEVSDDTDVAKPAEPAAKPTTPSLPGSGEPTTPTSHTAPTTPPTATTSTLPPIRVRNPPKQTAGCNRGCICARCA